MGLTHENMWDGPKLKFLEKYKNTGFPKGILVNIRFWAKITNL